MNEGSVYRPGRGGSLIGTVGWGVQYLPESLISGHRAPEFEGNAEPGKIVLGLLILLNFILLIVMQSRIYLEFPVAALSKVLIMILFSSNTVVLTFMEMCTSSGSLVTIYDSSLFGTER